MWFKKNLFQGKQGVISMEVNGRKSYRKFEPHQHKMFLFERQSSQKLNGGTLFFHTPHVGIFFTKLLQGILYELFGRQSSYTVASMYFFRIIHDQSRSVLKTTGISK